MAVGDIYQVRFAYRSALITAYNIRHYTVGTVVGTELSPAFLAQDCFDVIGVKITPLMVSEAQLRFCLTRKIWPLPVGTEFTSTGGSLQGQDAAPGLPTQVTGLIKLQGNGPAGRRSRGRFYVPFPAQGALAFNGFPNATYMTELGNLMNELLEDREVTQGVNTTTWVPAIYNRPGGYRSVVSGAARAFFATQRKRGAAAGSDDPI